MTLYYLYLCTAIICHELSQVITSMYIIVNAKYSAKYTCSYNTYVLLFWREPFTKLKDVLKFVVIFLLPSPNDWDWRHELLWLAHKLYCRLSKTIVFVANFDYLPESCHFFTLFLCIHSVSVYAYVHYYLLV